MWTARDHNYVPCPCSISLPTCVSYKEHKIHSKYDQHLQAPVTVTRASSPMGCGTQLTQIGRGIV